MKIGTIIGLATALPMLAWPALAPGAPQYFAETGHYYELIPSGLPEFFPWETVKAEAESRSYMGLAGYLATITSQAENDFIATNVLAPAPVDPYGRYWLGGYQPGGPEPDGGWEWITGEGFDYLNWAPGEPNNDSGAAYGHAEEDYLMMYRAGPWNDTIGEGVLMSGYVIEYGLAEPTLEAAVDIKPGSWPNPVNPRSRGVLPAAVCGTEAFDVTDIDPTTILLGLEGAAGAVSPIRWHYEDVCTPPPGDACDGHELEGDGFTDLTLKFKTQELVETLGLWSLAGETICLTLTGSLMDGSPFEGSDCIWALDPGDGNMDGKVDGADYTLWADHYGRAGGLGKGDFNEDGRVDEADFAIWADSYNGRGRGVLIPEPAALSLLAVGALALIRRRHA